MFRIAENGTHGVGWIATRDIAPDTPIFDEAAILTIPHAHIDNHVLVDQALSKLSESDREVVLTLYGRSPVEKLYMNGTPLKDFTTDFMGRHRNGMMAIFPKHARLNHSCRPNAASVLESDGISSVVAQRPICAGEEITISYLDNNLQECASRNQDLISKRLRNDTSTYANGCRCALCTGNRQEILESDGRRKQLRVYRDLLLRDRLSYSVLVDCISLMNDEGLYFALMGAPATLNMIELLGNSGGDEDSFNRRLFMPGTRVCLHKLKAKPELNGQTGVVVRALDAGRVGVQLDCSDLRLEPIAVKPGNLCRMRD